MIYKNSSASSLFLKIPIRFGLDALAAYRGLFAGEGGYFLAIAKAHLHFAKWVLFQKKKKNQIQNKKIQLYGTYHGCILWQYYFKNRKIFSEFIKGK